MDRCDTDPMLFLFASCGRPFMCVRNNYQALRLFKSERLRTIGNSIEWRHGNYAAATIDEMLLSWPNSTITSDPAGAFIHVEPCQVMEI